MNGVVFYAVASYHTSAPNIYSLFESTTLIALERAIAG